MTTARTNHSAAPPDCTTLDRTHIKESGGKYLGGGFNKAISLTGAPPPNRVVLIQFPDMDALKAFYVKEGQLEADIGHKYASFRAIGIEGVEQK